MTKTGDGTWTLSGTDVFTGATTVNAGTLVLDLATGSLASASTLTLGGGLFEARGASSGSSTQTLGGLTLTAGTNSAIGLDPNNGSSTTLNLGSLTRGAASTLLLDYSSGNTGTRTAATTDTGTGVNGVLGYALVKDGSGTGLARISGGNISRLTSFTALTASSDDTIAGPFRDYTTLGVGSLTWTAGGSLTDRWVDSLTLDTNSGGGTIDMGAATNVLTLASGALVFQGGNASETLTGGQVGATGSEVIVHQLGTGTGTLTISSLLSGGAGSLLKDGAGTLILGNMNTYTGTTTVDAGTLEAGAYYSAFGLGSAVTVASGATLDIGSYDQRIGSLAGSGTVDLSSAILQLTLDNSATVFSGLLSDDGGSALGGIGKTGNGTLTLTNNGNTFGGNVGVTKGILVTEGAGTIGTGSSTIQVGGDGSVGGGTFLVTSAAGGLGGFAGNPGSSITRNFSLSGIGSAGFAQSPTAQATASGGISAATGFIVAQGALASLGNNTVSGNVTFSPYTATRVVSDFGTLTLGGTVTVQSQTAQFGSSSGNSAQPNNILITGQVTGGASANVFQKFGNGTVILANATNNFANLVQIDAGFLRVDTGTELGTSTASNAIYMNGGTLEIRSDAPGTTFSSRNLVTHVTGTVFASRAVNGSGINQTVTFGNYGIDQQGQTQTFASRDGYGITLGTGTTIAIGTGGNSAVTNSLTGLLTLNNNFSIGDTSARNVTFNGTGDSLLLGNFASTGSADSQFVKQGSGTMTMQGGNYTGVGSFFQQGGTTAINAIGSVVTGNTAVNISTTTTVGTINYLGAAGTGTGETTAKVFNLQGTTGNSILLANQSGSAATALILASNIGTGNAGAKALVIGGNSSFTSADAAIINEIQGVIQDSSSGATGLTKTGSTTWLYDPATTNYSAGAAPTWSSGGAANSNTFIVSSVAGIGLGSLVTGTSIPAGAVVTAINASTRAITISNNIGTSLAAGTITFAATTGFTGNVTVAGGTLQFRPTATTGGGSNLIGDTANLVFTADSITGNGFAGGTFEYQGSAAGGTLTETLAQIQVASGAATVKTTANGGTPTLNFTNATTAISRTAGATLNFAVDAGTNITFTTANPTNATGIIGGYATYNGVDWATTTGTGPFTLAAYNSYTPGLPASGASATGNYLTTAATTVTTAAETINTLKLAGPQTITLGGTLSFTTATGGGVLFDDSTGAATIASSNPLFTLGAANAETILIVNGSNSANALTVSAPIGSGTGSLTKSGNGTVVIGSPNTYTGNTTIDAGTIKLAGALASLGSITTAGNVTTIRQGATLDINAAGPGHAVTIGALSGAGNVTNSGDNGSTAGTLQIGLLNSTTSTTAAVFSGVLQDGTGVLNVTMNKAGTGVQAFTGLNTYTGVTTIASGTLAVTALPAVSGPTGSLTLTTDGTNTATVSSAAGLAVGQTFGYNPNIAPGTTITAINGTTVTLSQNATGTGAVSTLFGVASSLGWSSSAAGNLVLGTSTTLGTLQYTGSNASIFQATQTPSVSTDRLFSLGGSGAIDSSGQFGNNVLGAGAANNAALIFNNTGDLGFTTTGSKTLTLTGNSTGDNEIDIHLINNTDGSPLNLTKLGTGLWILGNAANTYSGVTTIGAGALRAQDGVSLPTASNLFLNGGVLEMSGVFSRGLGSGAGQVMWGTNTSGGFAASTGKLTVDLAGGAQMYWGVGGIGNGTGTLILGSSTSLAETEFQNNINLGSGYTTTRTITVNDNTTTTTDYSTLSGNITGSAAPGIAALTISNGGVLIMTGHNTFTGGGNATAGTGGVALTNGTLVINSFAANGPLGALNGAGDIVNRLVMGSGANNTALTYVGTGETVTRRIEIAGSGGTSTIESDGSGPLVITDMTFTQTGTRTLNLRGNNLELNTVSALLQNNGTQALAVAKNDTGTWVLTNNANSYTGGTTVNGGVLILAGDGVLGSGNFILQNAAIQASGGTRTLANNVLVGGATSSINNEFSGTNSFILNGTVTNSGGSSALQNFLPTGGEYPTFTGGAIPAQDAAYTAAGGRTLTINGNISLTNDAAARTLIFRGAGVTILNGVVGNGGSGASVMQVDAAANTGLNRGPGLVILNGTAANTYTGGTNLLSGVLQINSSNSPLGTGRLALTSNSTSQTNGSYLQSTVDLTGANKLNIPIVFGNSTTATALDSFQGANDIEFGGAATNSDASNSIIINGITVTFDSTFGLSGSTTARTFTFAGTGNAIVQGIVGNNGGATTGGAGSLTKNGSGTLTLNGVNVFTGGVAVNNGTLIDNNSTTAANQLGATTLTLGGGTLIFNKADANASTQAYTTGALTANTSSTLTLNTTDSAGSQTVTTGVITRNAQSTAAFNLTGTGTNTVNVSTTALGDWATITTGGATNFATKNGSNNLVAVTTTANDTVATWTNTDLTDNAGYSGTYAGVTGVNSIRFNAAATSTVNIGWPGGPLNDLNVIAGGILVTSNVGAHAASIAGGNLASTGNELIVQQQNTGQAFTITSNLTNNPLTGAALTLTKAGNGTLILSGNNNYGYTGATSINEGTLQVSGGNAIGDTSNVILANKLSAVLDLDNGTETIGGLSGGGLLGSTLTAGVVTGTITVGGTVSIGTGSLTINQTGATSTYSGQITGSGNLIVTGTAQANILTLNTANNSFSGNLVVQGTQLALANGALTPGVVSSNLGNVATILIQNGGGLSIDNSGAFPANRVNDAAPITLKNTGPNATVTTVGLNYTSDQANLTAPRVENVGAVTLGAGANTIRVNASANGAQANLNLASLTRNNHSTLVILATNMDDPIADRRGDVTDTNALTDIIGNLIGGGSEVVGSPNISILPWAIGSNAGINAAVAGSLGNTFVTYNTSAGFGNGFRALSTAEYEQLVPTGGTTIDNNVRYSGSTSLTLTGTGHAVNALLLDNTSTVTGGVVSVSGSGAGDSLNIASGAILFTGSATPQSIALGGFGSGITTGTGEYILTQNDTAAGGVLISSNLTSAASLTKAGLGMLKLSGNNSNLTGPITVNQGTLGISSSAAINNLPVTLTGGSIGFTMDGDGTQSFQALSGGNFGVTIVTDSGFTVDRLGNGTNTGPLLFQTAANKNIQWGGTLSGFTNQTLTITNNNGYGLEFTAPLALSATVTNDRYNPAPTFNVATATASNVVQGFDISGQLTGGVTGAGNIVFIKSGNGTMVLGNNATGPNANTFGSAGSMIDITSGVLAAGSDQALGNASNVIRLNALSGTATFRATDDLTTSRTILLNNTANTRAIEVVAGKTLKLNTAFGVTAGAEAASLAKNDNGTLTFGNTVDNSSWLGNLTINAGSVKVTGNNNLGYTGGITIANALTASLLLDGTAGDLQIDKIISLSSSGVSSAGAIENLAGTNTIGSSFTQSITTASASTSVTTASTANLQVGQLITGPGIAANTTVASIVNGTTFTLSAAAARDSAPARGHWSRASSIWRRRPPSGPTRVPC
ncbi:MAG: autotransporter-associated beta strand repeat-containing protein [Chthoniobacter sp.]